MASTNDATVNAFYLAYYGRPADPAGLAFWSQALATSNGDFSSIISAFSTSAEATAHIGTGTATDQISNVYQQLFGHAPDAAGLAYWTDAISNGNMSLADAAFQITQGAQTSDLTVSTLRQEAAAQFTATIAASGVDYDGDAGIAAGRVMIAAVNAKSSTADIQSLVTAGASLAQTAHDNPAVIAALANGGDLSTLLSTSSGQSDPVALIQALASIGKAALTDPTGLTALLNGGGVAGLLASLPAGTTIKDVAAAVDSGGLAAGTTVATMPVDTTPVNTTPVEFPTSTTTKIAFNGVDGTDLPAGTTLSTNSNYYFVDVPGLAQGSKLTFQVSATGKAGTWVTTDEQAALADGTHYIRYQITAANGTKTVTNALELVMNSKITNPSISFVENNGVSDHDNTSSKGDLKVTGLDANESWAYSYDGKTWTAGTTTDGVGLIADNGITGKQTVQIRTLEKNVNGITEFTSTEVKYVVEKSVSGTLLTTGSQASEVTTNNNGLSFKIQLADGHVDDITTTYEVSNSGDEGSFMSWTPGQSLADGTYYFRANIKDLANNQAMTNIVTVHLDNVVPVAPTVQLVYDSGVNGDGITYNGAFTVSGLEQGGSWQYTLDGVHWNTGTAIGLNGTATAYDPVAGPTTVQVVSIDAAGNKSAATSLYVNLDTRTPAEGVKFDHVDGGAIVNGVIQTTLSHPDVVFSYTGTILATDTVTYSLNNSPFMAVDPAMINKIAKTITFADLDLSTSDASLAIHITSQSGILNGSGTTIIGPYVNSTAFVNNGDLLISLGADKVSHIYLTDGSNASVQVHSSDASGDTISGGWVTLGVQTKAAQGILSVGPTATIHTDSTISNSNGGDTYALGTDSADTLSGNYVFAYGGDDVITAVANANNYGKSMIYGGLGSDQIHLEASKGNLLYLNASESTIVADATTAHGFDTLYVSTGSTSFNQQLSFAGVSLDQDNYERSGIGYTGTETGNALLSLLNGAVNGTLPSDGMAHADFIDFGMIGGKDVHFLVVDTHGDGVIGSDDYVVKIVGDITQVGFGGQYMTFQSGNGAQ